MHGLMSYQRFGRTRSLRSDRAEQMLGRERAACMYGTSVMTELGSSVFRSSYSDLSVAGLGMFPMAYKELPNTEEVAIDLEEEEVGLEEDVEIDRQERINVDRRTTVNIDRQSGNNIDRRSTPAEPGMKRVYRTLPPFPPNKTQTKRELDKAICKKTFDKITLEMPLSDAIKVSPSVKKICKRHGIQQLSSR
ncbi:hypothetical protein F2Q69_00036848 [Brassica cretica]|uniref:Uncharacterized protein n=1 Tax=Brassica cretica TaxID=69181 RepID=A0A8S9SPA3_BRACR|nr:hypothetical protein F2Q69_00036848 [Brassica cretica]